MKIKNLDKLERFISCPTVFHNVISQQHHSLYCSFDLEGDKVPVKVVYWYKEFHKNRVPKTGKFSSTPLSR